ncbi:MAG: hypothetical protein JSR26_05200 [Proteobacteria bacterium]|nr:hypothetical protein [Pseudomonadota bacterium]
MKVRFTEAEAASLLALPRPDTKAMKDTPQAEKDAIDNRVNALVSLLECTPISQVAKTYNLHRRTLSRMLDLMAEPALGGGLNGFGVCMPGARLVDPQPRQVGLPLLGRAHDMARLVQSLPEIGSLFTKFKGALPTRRQASPAFDRFFLEVKRVLKAHGLQEGYPLNTNDGGRRAVSSFIARARVRAGELAMAFTAPSALTKWEELAPIRPFDECQADAHYIDLKGQVFALPLADGTYVLTPISGLLIIAEIDVGSRSCVSWMILIDSSYDQFDLLETLARGLTPWCPKDVSGLNMRYLANAWMPTAGEELPPRPLKLSLDNFSAHIAKHARRTMVHHQLGVYRFGVSGIPETRAVIEAFFKMIEQRILRFLAGGFEPETKVRAEQRVSNRRATDYPIFPELLETFVDIGISSYNVTAHAEMHNRSPREVTEHFIACGGMPLRSSRSPLDAMDMRRMRVQVVVRGGNGVLPHVNYGYGVYRHDKLNARDDLIGKKFDACVDSDARFLTLLENGLPYLTLEVLPPYARSPHTLTQRRRAERLRKSDPDRWHNVPDMIEAYHADVRECARRLKWAADEVASGSTPRAPAPPRQGAGVAAQTLTGLPPRGGPVAFRRR